MSQEDAFWDSSALVPLIAHQPMSAWAEEMAVQWNVIVWWAAPVEIYSAIARLHRLGTLGTAGMRFATGQLSAMKRDWYEIAPSDEVREEAQRLLGIYSLRAAAGLQLAAAMVWCRKRPKGRAFLCADVRLAEAATQVGFTALEP